MTHTFLARVEKNKGNLYILRTSIQKNRTVGQHA